MLRFIKKIFPDKVQSKKTASIAEQPLINSADDICRYAATFLDQGRYLQALEQYQIAIKTDGKCSKAYRLAGYILKEQGKFPEAETYLRTAITLDEHDADACYMLGDIYKNQQQFSHAIPLLKKACLLDTENGFSAKALIYCFHKIGDNNEALELTNAELQKYPNECELLLYKGSIESQLLALDQAESSYTMALVEKPNSIVLLKYLAEVQYNQNKLSEAIANHEKILAIEPQNSEIRLAMGFCQLAQGNLLDGFKNYQERYNINSDKKLIPSLNRPLWDGKTSLKDKVLLVVAEQGYGDFIQFVRYTEMIKNSGGKFILYVHNPILELMSRSFGADCVVSNLDLAPSYDYYCSIMSLPYAFGSTLDTIPKSVPYLASDPALVGIWRERLAAYSNKLLVGISWSGNRKFERDRFRSIDLTEFLALIDNKHNYVVLQTNFNESETALLKSYSNIYLPGQLIQSFSDTAAIIELCQYIVSVDTAIAHLAGALGKQTHLLLPHVPDWRWLLERDDSPWYPTLRLHRQKKLLCWGETIKCLGNELTTHNTLPPADLIKH